VREDGENLRMQIADDGVGFNPLRAKKDSFGLFNVRQRLSSLGGRLEIESEMNRGTRAVIVLPIRFARTDAHGVAHSSR
jgi:signal transduction histidine kinase